MSDFITHLASLTEMFDLGMKIAHATIYVKTARNPEKKLKKMANQILGYVESLQKHQPMLRSYTMERDSNEDSVLNEESHRNMAHVVINEQPITDQSTLQVTDEASASSNSLENSQQNHTQRFHSSQSNDLQSVEKNMSPPPLIVLDSRTKREATTQDERERYLKRRYSMRSDVSIKSNSDIHSPNDGIVDDTESRMAKAMKKRRTAIRQTISIPIHEIANDNDGERMAVIPQKNTDKIMHAKNDWFRKWCILCNEPQKYMVVHYVKEHQNYEVLISRPSPTMAQKFRDQALEFLKIKNKIVGICLFCDENKCMDKHQWAAHHLTHTGEKMFICDTCNTTFKAKGDHMKNCHQQPVNIYTMNIDGSIMGFICKDCNYLQLYRGNMIKHLKNEHGINDNFETGFEQFTLIPDVSTIQPKCTK